MIEVQGMIVPLAQLDTERTRHNLHLHLASLDTTTTTHHTNTTEFHLTMPLPSPRVQQSLVFTYDETTTLICDSQKDTNNNNVIAMAALVL
eukprot:scaffold43259_cov66-Attheya_sp.AAC.6